MNDQRNVSLFSNAELFSKYRSELCAREQMAVAVGSARADAEHAEVIALLETTLLERLKKEGELREAVVESVTRMQDVLDGLRQIITST